MDSDPTGRSLGQDPQDLQVVHNNKIIMKTTLSLSPTMGIVLRGLHTFSLIPTTDIQGMTVSHFIDTNTEAYRGLLPKSTLAIQWLRQISSPRLFQLKFPLEPQCVYKRKSVGDSEKRKMPSEWKIREGFT